MDRLTQKDWDEIFKDKPESERIIDDKISQLKGALHRAKKSSTPKNLEECKKMFCSLIVDIMNQKK